TAIGGAYLPAGATHPFNATFAGGVLSAGRDEFRVHLGYQFVRVWGTPFPDVDSIDGGLGMTGVEIRVAPRMKFLFAILNYAQTNSQPGVEPFYAYAVTTGLRVYGGSLSADVGLAAGEAHNLKMSR